MEALHTSALQRTHVPQRGRPSRRRRASGGRTSATAAPKQRPSCCHRVSSVHERTARTGAPSSSASATPAAWRAWPAPGRTTPRNRACGAVAARERSSRAAAWAASSARTGASRTAAPGPRSTRLASRPSCSISRRGGATTSTSSRPRTSSRRSSRRHALRRPDTATWRRCCGCLKTSCPWSRRGRASTPCVSQGRPLGAPDRRPGGLFQEQRGPLSRRRP